MIDFAARLNAIPANVLRIAKSWCGGDAPMEDVLRYAEFMLRHRSETEVCSEDVPHICVWLTNRQARLIRDAVLEHETVIDEDVSALFGLRGWFSTLIPRSNGGAYEGA